MPYLITFVWYPPDKANQIAQRYLENLQKYPVPSYIKRVVPAASSSSKEGIEVINIDEVKQEDVGKALEYVAKFMIASRDIEGYRYYTRIFYTISEGLKFIGMD